jgi:hypothetical protein
MSNPRSLETPQQPRKVFLDFPQFCGTLNSVDNYMWSAGGLFTLSAAEGLTLFFLRQPFRPCQSETIKIASFKINHLRNAFFVTPFF